MSNLFKDIIQYIFANFGFTSKNNFLLVDLFSKDFKTSKVFSFLEGENKITSNIYAAETEINQLKIKFVGLYINGNDWKQSYLIIQMDKGSIYFLTDDEEDKIASFSQDGINLIKLSRLETCKLLTGIEQLKEIPFKFKALSDLRFLDVAEKMIIEHEESVESQ